MFFGRLGCAVIMHVFDEFGELAMHVNLMSFYNGKANDSRMNMGQEDSVLRRTKDAFGKHYVFGNNFC